MRAQRVFFAAGCVVAAFTAAMMLARMGGLRPEALPFAARLPADTVLYVAIPDHAAFADSVEGSAAWRAVGLAPALERYRKAQARLAAVAGPSAAFVVRRDGRWAAFFRLRRASPEPSGEVDGLRWEADGDVVAVSDTAEGARSALSEPRLLIDVDLLANDRREVCGASRAPFGWLDLRRTRLPGRLADIAAVGFTAAFGDAVEVRAIGLYYAAARPRALAEFVHQPRVSPLGAPGAAAWAVGFESAPDLWQRWTAGLSEKDWAVVQRALDAMAVEFLRKGTVESDVIPRIGPAWGIAVYERPEAVAWAEVPDGFEPILARAVRDAAKFRRDRGLVPVAELDGGELRLPWIPEDEAVRPRLAVRQRRLFAGTWGARLDEPSTAAFAAPGAGEWHVAGGVRVAEARGVLEEVERRFGWREQAGAVRALLDRVPWMEGVQVKGRYTDAGLRVEGTIRVR